jgi:hypothetical protein
MQITRADAQTLELIHAHESYQTLKTFDAFVPIDNAFQNALNNPSHFLPDENLSNYIQIEVRAKLIKLFTTEQLKADNKKNVEAAFQLFAHSIRDRVFRREEDNIIQTSNIVKAKFRIAMALILVGVVAIGIPIAIAAFVGVGLITGPLLIVGTIASVASMYFGGKSFNEWAGYRQNLNRQNLNLENLNRANANVSAPDISQDVYTPEDHRIFQTNLTATIAATDEVRLPLLTEDKAARIEAKAEEVNAVEVQSNSILVKVKRASWLQKFHYQHDSQNADVKAELSEPLNPTPKPKKLRK